MRNHKKLKKAIDEMVALAKRVYPKVEYIVVDGGMSGQDATIKFFSPARYEDKLDTVLVKKECDLLDNEGLFISALTLSKKLKPNHTLHAK